MKACKKLVSGFMCVVLLMTCVLSGTSWAMADTTVANYEDYYVVGKLQQENQISRKSIAGHGLANVSVNLPAPLDISKHNPANLVLTYELRVTRDDQVTGAGSLSKVVNGLTRLSGADGSECFKAKVNGHDASPVQESVASEYRIAGIWMPVAISLETLSKDADTIGKLELQDYNDFPKANPPINTGITYEVRNARIIDISMGADGTSVEEYTATLKAELAALLDKEWDAAAPDRLQTAYTAAKSTAENVLNQAAASLADVSEALRVLNAAQIATDKTALESLVNSSVDTALYTEDSLALYNAALQNAQTILKDVASCGEVDDITDALQAAIDGLTPVAVADGTYGDLNADGSTSAEDALLALQGATQKIALSIMQQAMGNVDGVGNVTAADALMILQYTTKKIDDIVPSLSANVNTDPITFCNPLNLNYMYSYSIDIGNYQITGSNKSREAADPAVVIFEDEYYLFASHNDGYWVSKDLADWEFILLDTEKFPQFRKFAPATCVVGDTLYVSFSEGGALMKTTDPRDPDAWEMVRAGNDWVDPALYYDDPAQGGDGYVYAFTGLSPDAPIRGCKLDPVTMEKVTDWVDLFNSDKDNHGFEVPGNDNTNYSGSPYLEGAWLNKHDGKYYLTYAIPGTGDASYCDGCYVSEEGPLGPYTFCENSPVVWKASGYAVGAGHGCLFEDLSGNWWKVDTVSIMTTGWERRLAIFPAIFDEDGDLFTNTVFGDYPTYIPTDSEEPFTKTGPGWNLLSYGKEATASSSLKDTRYAFDESIRSWWSAETGNINEWLEVDLGRMYPVWSVQVNFADQDIDPNVYGRDNDFRYEYLMEFSQDGEHWHTMVDRQENTKDMPHDYIEFEEAVIARYIRITNKGDIPAGGKFAISGLRVFGEGGSVAPAEVSDVSVYRYPQNERSASISWQAVKGAQGYIVHFGTKEGALYNHYQVIGDNFITLNCLNKGVDYYFRVDAYNESGVTIGTQVVAAPWTQEPTIKDEQEDGKPRDVMQNPNYIVYEAENAKFGNTTPPNGATVGVYNDAEASGGKTLHNMEHAGAYFEFTNVDGGSGGDAVMWIGYINGNSSSKTEIFVNGTSIGVHTLPGTGNWSTPKMIAIPLTGLYASTTNTIRFEANSNGYNPDWIQVIGDTPTQQPSQPMDEVTIAEFTNANDKMLYLYGFCYQVNWATTSSVVDCSSATSANGAKEDYYFDAIVTVDAVPGATVNCAEFIKEYGLNLRSADGKETNLLMTYSVVMEDANTLHVRIPLSEMSKKDIDWTQVKDMFMLFYLGDEYRTDASQSNPFASIHISDAKIVQEIPANK